MSDKTSVSRYGGNLQVTSKTARIYTKTDLAMPLWGGSVTEGLRHKILIIPSNHDVTVHERYHNKTFLEDGLLSVKESIDDLREEIADLRSRLESVLPPPTEKQNPVQFASDEQAADAVAEFFLARRGESVYPSDVASAFCMEYEKVLKILRSLEESGRIKKAIPKASTGRQSKGGTR